MTCFVLANSLQGEWTAEQDASTRTLESCASHGFPSPVMRGVGCKQKMNEGARYSTGELAQVGDRVTYDDEPGTVELVVTEDNPQWKTYWSKLGTGVMIVNESLGRVYVSFGDELLGFIGRP